MTYRIEKSAIVNEVYSFFLLYASLKSSFRRGRREFRSYGRLKIVLTEAAGCSSMGIGENEQDFSDLCDVGSACARGLRGTGESDD